MTRWFHHLSQSKLLNLLAKGGLTVFALWLVLRKVDMTELGAAISRQDREILLLAFALLVGQLIFCALRWHIILATLAGRAPMPKSSSLRIYTIGAFFNVCLPGTVGGDVVRVFLCRPGVAMPLAIHSVIIDRLAALAGLLVLVALTMPWLAADYHFQALPAVLGLMALVLSGLLLLFKADAWLARFKPLLYFAANVRLLFGHAAATLASAVISVATQFSSCVVVWLLAMSLGAHPTLLQCTTLVPPVMLAAMLPISVGGWGVREAGMVAMLSLAGIPQETALIISVQLGLLVALTTTPGGWLWLKKPASISMPSMTRGPGRTK